MVQEKVSWIPLRDKKKTAYLGVYLALALICSYVESLIPFYFGIPGVKLGPVSYTHLEPTRLVR